MQAEERLQNIKKFAIYCHAEHLIFVLRNISLHKALLKCPLTVSKVSVVRLIENIKGVSKVRSDCKLYFAQSF